MSLIQEEFNKSTGNFTLAPGEYEGPLIINRPCTVYGHNSTVWANNGPVVVVDSESVTLKDIRIEVTGDGETERSAISLKLNHQDTVLENIEINGRSEGIDEEADGCSIPAVIALGDFAANKENCFSVELNAPKASTLVHNLKDVAISPSEIIAGRNVLSITTGNMRDNTILFGEILVKSRVTRRIYVTGKAKKNAPERISPTHVSGELPISAPLQIDPPDTVVAPIICDDENVQQVSKGHRVPLGKMCEKTIKVVYSHKGISRPLVVDPYVFRLGKNGKVPTDEDLVFFGNEESTDKDVHVKTNEDNSYASIELPKTSESIDKIAVCLSIYDDQSGTDFSCVENPVIRIFSEEKERFRFMLEDLAQEKTVVAVEFYRYKGEWKLRFIGGGYTLGLDYLCREYGVEVE